MTPEEFIRKWQAVTLTERSAAQSHFIDLCRLLEVPAPTEADLHGEFYAFEKVTAKDGGGQGFADVWYQSHFAWEYKKKHANLDAALSQLRQYSGALGNPPLLVVSDMERIRIVPQFTGYVTTPIEIAIAGLGAADVRERLRWLWMNPEALKPTLTREIVTLTAARQFSQIADRLRTEDRADPHTVAHFLIRILFCLFAENIGLLPPKHFTAMLERFRGTPEGVWRRTGQIFAVMATGGTDGNDEIRHFNGDLFTSATEELVRLQPDDLGLLWHATGHDWSSVAPSIFGTLFERGLDPAKRSQIGAHYTSENDILAIVEPVVMQPLRRAWDDTRARLDRLAARDRAGSPDALRLLGEMQSRIGTTTILDPACGSGNFLYVTLKLLHDLEFEVITWHAQHNLTRPFPTVGPHQLFGMEINQYAAELARAVIWIGHLQWMLDHGYSASDPVLQRLENIRQADSLIAVSGDAPPRRVEWPVATCIVSNPPFLGDKVMRSEHGGNRGGMGDEYVDILRSIYGGIVPGGADLVCYFVAHAWEQMRQNKYQRVGMITTNSIRGGANRLVLDTIKMQKGNLFMAWADREWVLDGAAVRISMIGFDRGEEQVHTLDGQLVSVINPDLTSDIDLTIAHRLAENTDIAFIGTQKSGPFDIDSATAQQMIMAKGNPNGRPNSDVVKPWMNGSDIVRRPRTMLIIDFNEMTMEEAALYENPFEYVKKHVLPKREKTAKNYTHAESGRPWWRHARPRPEMRRALAPLKRYILTPRVSKHRIFIWVDAGVIPDSATVAFARDDDYFLGVLHSHAHEIWSLRLGTWLGVGNDPRYTPTTTFETFPFPHPSDVQREAIAGAARRLVAQRDAWLTPPDASEAELKRRTLTNLYNAKPQWLLNAHAALDRIVYAAYGWEAEIDDDEILRRLLAENLRRSAAPVAAIAIEEEAAGETEEPEDDA